MATEICVNIGSDNGLLPDGTKPLPEPMLTDHQWSPSDTHIRAISQEMLQPSITKICLKITNLNINSDFPGANKLKIPDGFMPTESLESSSISKIAILLTCCPLNSRCASSVSLASVSVSNRFSKSATLSLEKHKRAGFSLAKSWNRKFWPLLYPKAYKIHISIYRNCLEAWKRSGLSVRILIGLCPEIWVNKNPWKGISIGDKISTRQIWGIWKLRPAYSPETPNLGQNRWSFVPCDLEIWWMTLENNRAPLLCCFKLCATYHSHRWIQTGVADRKRPIWVKFDDF